MRIKRLNKSDLRVLGWSVLFAATIWLLRSLSESVPVTLRLPVVAELPGQPDQEWTCQPDTLVIHTRSSGFSVLGFNLWGEDRALELRITKEASHQTNLLLPLSSLSKELRKASRGIRLEDAHFSSDTLSLRKRASLDESSQH